MVYSIFKDNDKNYAWLDLNISSRLIMDSTEQKNFLDHPVLLLLYNYKLG